MSVGRGGGSADPAVSYPDGPYRSLSDREVQAIRIAQEDTGTGAEFDIIAPATELWPILGEFEDRLVVVKMVHFYLEGGPDTSFIAGFMNDRAIDRPPATPDAPDYSVNQGQGTNILKFYASGLDIGTSDGAVIREKRPPTSQDVWFILDEDDDLFINWNYGAATSENHILEAFVYYEVVEV